MKSVLSLLAWVIIATIIIVTLGMLSPTIWMVYHMYRMGEKEKSPEIHLTGHYLQAQTVLYEGAKWAKDHNDFEPYYEDQILISGKRVDPDELKAIINKTAPDLISDAHILEVYEIAPDELLLKVSTGHVDGNIHQIVIIRIKATAATATSWHIYNFSRDLAPTLRSISQSVIPGWVQIDDRSSSRWLHLVDINSSRAYSFHGRIVNVDYPYVVLSDYPDEYNTEESNTTDTVFKVVNMQNGKTESELKFFNDCYVFPKTVTDAWDAESLTNSWKKYFSFDRNKIAVTFKKQYRRTFRNPAAHSSSHCAVD
jgi:hypothetical protein